MGPKKKSSQSSGNKHHSAKPAEKHGSKSEKIEKKAGKTDGEKVGSGSRCGVFLFICASVAVAAAGVVFVNEDIQFYIGDFAHTYFDVDIFIKHHKPSIVERDSYSADTERRETDASKPSSSHDSESVREKSESRTVSKESENKIVSRKTDRNTAESEKVAKEPSEQKSHEAVSSSETKSKEMKESEHSSKTKSDKLTDTESVETRAQSRDTIDTSKQTKTAEKTGKEESKLPTNEIHSEKQTKTDSKSLGKDHDPKNQLKTTESKPSAKTETDRQTQTGESKPSASKTKSDKQTKTESGEQIKPKSEPSSDTKPSPAKTGSDKRKTESKPSPSKSGSDINTDSKAVKSKTDSNIKSPTESKATATISESDTKVKPEPTATVGEMSSDKQKKKETNKIKTTGENVSDKTSKMESQPSMGKTESGDHAEKVESKPLSAKTKIDKDIKTEGKPSGKTESAKPLKIEPEKLLDKTESDIKQVEKVESEPLSDKNKLDTDVKREGKPSGKTESDKSSKTQTKPALDKTSKTESKPSMDKTELDKQAEKVESRPVLDKLDKNIKTGSKPSGKTESDKSSKTEPKPSLDKIESDKQTEKVESRPSPGKSKLGKELKTEVKPDQTGSDKKSKTETKPSLDKTELNKQAEKVESRPVLDKLDKNIKTKGKPSDKTDSDKSSKTSSLDKIESDKQTEKVESRPKPEVKPGRTESDKTSKTESKPSLVKTESDKKAKEVEPKTSSSKADSNKSDDKTPESVKPPYSKSSITNVEDNKIRGRLDVADEKFEKGDFESALTLFDDLLTKYPVSPRAMSGKGLTLDMIAESRRSNKILEEAINTMQAVLELPGVPDALFIKTGKRLAERQQFRGWGSKATRTWNTMVEKFPNDFDLRNQLGVSYLMTAQNQEAKQAFKEVLELDPENGFAKAHMGFILKTSDNNPVEAIPLLKEGINSKAPGTFDGRFYLQLGDALLRISQSEEAQKYFQEAAEGGLFLSKDQRSLYNINELTGRPWWTPDQLGASRYIQMLEDNWETIRDEGLANLDHEKGTFMPEEENLRETGDWKQMTLYQQGRKNKKLCEKAPKTCALIDQIPGVRDCRRGQVKFSVMHPGVHVWPHCGPTNCRIRAHLGLIVPPGPKIRVVNETREWKEGKFIIFDDSFEHEVWHDGKDFRLVLIVDFWHPELSQELRSSLSPI